mmetsp:Transcript_55092/g.171126  ORF Transcript_55092/g.171126 Transcript_55092/m.171126 type:complete len:206 (+) Transcript_55092:1199-1816(+)
MDALDARVLVDLCRGKVELKAVTSRQHRNLLHDMTLLCAPKVDELAGVAIPVLLLHGELLAHLHGRIVMAEAHDVHLHHGVDLILRFVTETRELLHGILLHLAHPLLGVAVHLLELLPQLALADGQRGLPEAVDRADERSEQLVHLTEDTSELRLPEALHGLDNVAKLAAAEKFCLPLQRRDLRHEVCHCALDIIKARQLLQRLP